MPNMVCYFFSYHVGVVKMCLIFIICLLRRSCLNRFWKSILWLTLSRTHAHKQNVVVTHASSMCCIIFHLVLSNEFSWGRRTVQQHGVKIHLALVRWHFSHCDYKSPRGPIQNPTTTCSGWCNMSETVRALNNDSDSAAVVEKKKNWGVIVQRTLSLCSAPFISAACCVITNLHPKDITHPHCRIWKVVIFCAVNQCYNYMSLM